MSFIVQQPNGLYCRFGTVTKCPTEWNMTEGECVDVLKGKYGLDEMGVLTEMVDRVREFEKITANFEPKHMTRYRFEKIRKTMKEPRDGEMVVEGA
jgi:hypothetical protein